MKHKLLFRRFFASLLLLAVSALSWAYDFEVDGIYYSYHTKGGFRNTVYVTYKDYNSNCYSGDITIPSIVTYDVKYEVVGIYSRAFQYCSDLTSVTIPESVTSIDKGAFQGCSGLTSINVASDNPNYDSRNNCNAIIETATNTLIAGCKNTVIPENVTSIGDCAFYECSGLTSITIPESVTSIGSNAFGGCSGLGSISVDENNPVYDSRNHCNAIIETTTNTLLVGCKNTTIPNSVTSIGDYAFYYCSSLTSITIPESVTSIGDDAFYICSGLTSITIPNSVTSIGDQAFLNCSGLTSVTIGNSVTSIGTYAFRNCSGLTSITIPNSVTSIGDYTFSDCSGLTSVTLNSNAIVSKEYSSYSNLGTIFGSQVTEYVLGDGVTSIGKRAFELCSSLTSVTIPEGVTSIGYAAFSSCIGLTSITLPSTLTSTGDGSFWKCTGLTAVHISDLDAYCRISFGWYTPLLYAHKLYLNGEEVTGELVFPDGITSVSNVAFEGCTGITSVVLPEGVTSIGQAAFKSTNITSVSLPESLTSIGNEAFQYCSSLTSVTIPNSVTSIGEYAFSGCTSLPETDNIRYADTYLVEAVDKTKSTYNIKQGTRFIGNEAFYDCSDLTSITIPNSVTSIGESAFSGCSGLASVTLNSNAIVSKNYTSESSLKNIFRTQVEEYIIGDGVTSIGGFAFSGCSGLKSVTIPESVTSIGNEAFADCSSLTSVTCKVKKTDVKTSDLETPDQLKPSPGIDPADISAADYLYPFNPAHPDDPTTANVDETTEVTAGNVYPEEECRALWLDYYKKVFNNRQATQRANNKWTSLNNNPYIKSSSTEVVLLNTYIGLWNEYLKYAEWYSVIINYESVPTPVTAADVFDNVYLSGATLYVYESVIDAYRATAPWSEFGQILPIPDGPEAVEELKSEVAPEAEVNAPIYDLMGRRLQQKPASGYYIQGGKKFFVK